MIIKQEQIDVLKLYIANSEELIESDDIEALLFAIDDSIFYLNDN